MIVRNSLAAIAVVALMMSTSTASYAGGLCPLDLLSHGRAAPAKAAKPAKAAPKKVAAAPAKPAKPAPKK